MERIKILLTSAALLLAAACLGADFYDFDRDNSVPEHFVFSVMGEKALLQECNNYLLTDSVKEIDSQKYPVIIYLEEVVISDGLPTALRHCFAEAVKFPQFAREYSIEGVVVISFFFDGDGNIRIRDSYSNNELLKQYVLDRIKSTRQSDCTVWIGKEYVVRFLFRII